jgi:hypothetical protein
VPLLVHVMGWALLLRDRVWRLVAAIGALGSVMLLAGSVGEFWIFSADSYQSATRLASWMMFLLGALVTVVGFIALAIRYLEKR